MRFPSPLSRLMAGTAQLGMPYGIANSTGQPNYAQVLAIVEAAVAGGINCFDTAATYGTSEECLGRALHDLGVADNICVVTKIRPLSAAERADSQLARRAIESSVEASRQRLQLDCLPLVLFHHEQDVQFLPFLQSLQSRGRLHQIGASCGHSPETAAALAATAGITALQLPASALDQRHLNTPLLRDQPAAELNIFVRSVFLQGLLLMVEDQIPAALRKVVPARHRLRQLAAEAGISPAELCVRFVLSFARVQCVVVGTETVEQLQQNIIHCGRGPLPDDLKDLICTTLPAIELQLLTPSLWSTL
ncbi:MAG: aldo/keto reductase [Planctomycetaceae bacterium]|nr:aldo/keto reductase [Planctomycetaceae bacterium]